MSTLRVLAIISNFAAIFLLKTMLKKTVCALYVAVLVVMGAATFVEASEGTPFVHRLVYGTWWFAVLWAALAVGGAIYLTRCRERRAYVVLLHVSFLVILSGALLTHLTGRSGTIHLRMGQQQCIAEIEHNGNRYLHRLDFSMELTDFQIIEDENGNVTDFRSSFCILPNGEPLCVSMNNIATYGNLRFYQMSYDNDLRGSTLMINRDPYGIPVTYCGYVMLFASFIWLVVRGYRGIRNYRGSRHFRILGTTLFLTAAWCVYYFILDGSWTQIPVLRHPLLIFHVVIIILAYALLLIQAVRSFYALIVHSQSSILNSQILRLALCLLSIGIFLGAIWANISWGNYWSWDSKETWALITLMIYALPVHRRSLPVFNNPRVFHTYMLCAFLTVLMTYFGVNYLLTGLHSYN